MASEPFSIAFNWSPYKMEKSEWEEFYEKGDFIFEN
jgi:hypothetical protein